MKRVSIIFIIIFASVLAVSSASAITGKIGNARAVLYPEVGFFGTSIDRTIQVINENEFSVNISIEADQNSTGIIEVIDKSFILEAGESKDARFKIKLKKSGDYEARVNVFFTRPDSKEAGAALSSVLIIHAKSKSGENNDDSGTAEENENAITGNIVKDSFSKNKAVIAVSLSTLILIALLILLLYLNKRRKIKAKRSEKSQ